MWFSDKDYVEKGNLIKWNPAIKTEDDRDAILKAVVDGKIDVIATDHAPHTLEEKEKEYLQAPSGGPLVQHALPAMLELYHHGKISLEQIAEKMAHNVAVCFQVEKRGFIREGYWADIAIVNLNAPWNVNKDNILYKCKWSPFEGTTFRSKIIHTLVSGNLAWSNGTIANDVPGKRMTFVR
jgi:dihydroorotase